MLTIRNFTGQNFVGLQPWERTTLTGNITYYVRTDGSDSNTGLANTSGEAFATIQKGVDTILQTLDTRGYTCTIQVADGTYSTGAIIQHAVVGGGQITINGNSGTPSNVLISTTSGTNAFWVRNVPSVVYLSGMKIQAPAACAIISHRYSTVQFSNLNFGPCGTHMYSFEHGFIQALGAYTISGGAGQHINCQNESLILLASGFTVTLTGTPAFTDRFAVLQNMSYVNCYSSTFSGAATGPRYYLNMLCGVLTGLANGNVNYFPGNSAGSVLNSSQYV